MNKFWGAVTNVVIRGTLDHPTSEMTTGLQIEINSEAISYKAFSFSCLHKLSPFQLDFMTCIPVVILKSISRILATFLDILVDIIKILWGLNFHNKNTTALVFKEKMFWFISLMLLHLPIFDPSLSEPGNHGDSGLWEEESVKTKQLLMSLLESRSGVKRGFKTIKVSQLTLWSPCLTSSHFL